MSVVVKDMEMPSCCSNCEWSKLVMFNLCFCQIAKKSGDLEVAKNKRMDFCPLASDVISLDKWNQLKETIIELEENNDGECHRIAHFLHNLMLVIETDEEWNI